MTATHKACYCLRESRTALFSLGPMISAPGGSVDLAKVTLACSSIKHRFEGLRSMKSARYIRVTYTGDA